MYLFKKPDVTVLLRSLHNLEEMDRCLPKAQHGAIWRVATMESAIHGAVGLGLFIFTKKESRYFSTHHGCITGNMTAKEMNESQINFY